MKAYSIIFLLIFMGQGFLNGQTSKLDELKNKLRACDPELPNLLDSFFIEVHGYINNQSTDFKENIDSLVKDRTISFQEDVLTGADVGFNTMGVLLALLSLIIAIVGLGLMLKKKEKKSAKPMQNGPISNGVPEVIKHYNQCNSEGRLVHRYLISDVLETVGELVQDKLFYREEYYEAYHKIIFEHQQIMGLYIYNENNDLDTLIKKIQTLYGIGTHKSIKHLKFLSEDLNIRHGQAKGNKKNKIIEAMNQVDLAIKKIQSREEVLS